MSKALEFVRDPESPAIGQRTYSLKAVPINLRNPNGSCELVKYRRASEWGLDVAIEPGVVGGLLGIRALRLWDAQGPGYQRLDLDAAIEKSEGTFSKPQLFLTSRTPGGYAVSSCLGYDDGLTRRLTIPSASRLYDDDIVVPRMTMVDYSLADSPEGLVDKHLSRAEVEGFDVRVPLGNAVDLELASVLSALPESSK